MTNNPYIPSRFCEEILTHIAGVYSSKTKDFPLILGIFGNPGQGKTFMCEQIFLQYAIKKYEFSIQEFENPSSGIPAKKLRERYDKIVENFTNNYVYGVLMINDIDTAIGNWGEMHQYTVNTQHVIGELMQLSDPHINLQKRVPIILTGNDLSSLYAPLKRNGRIAPFYWLPSQDDIIMMVRGEYPELTQEEVQILVKTLGEQASDVLNGKKLPVSFYTSLKSKIYRERISTAISQQKSIGPMIREVEASYRKSVISLEDLMRIGASEIKNILAMEVPHLGKEAKQNGRDQN